MNTYKNEILSMLCIAFVTVFVLILPVKFIAIVLTLFVTSMAMFKVIQNYDINYKYWFSFAGQLLGLMFVAVSFIAGLSFIANYLS